jgi:hypothetical protein
MSSSLQSQPRTDAIALIQQEISNAETERRAISRQTLADLLHLQVGMPHADAARMVDAFCDERAPGVPYYLQEEFAIPYLKVVAVANVLLGIGAFYWGITVFQKTKQTPYTWLCVGTIFIGLGALAWVKSLERYAARKANRQG